MFIIIIKLSPIFRTMTQVSYICWRKIMEYIEALCDNCVHLLGVSTNLTNHNCSGKLIPLEIDHDDYITLCKVWSTGNEVDYTVHWDLYIRHRDLCRA